MHAGLRVASRDRDRPETLCRYLPPPRVHLVLYDGVLTPHSKPRAQIVLSVELMRRGFELDVLVCPWFAGPRKVIALIHDPPTARKILVHLGLPSQAPRILPARPPLLRDLPASG